MSNKNFDSLSTSREEISCCSEVHLKYCQTPVMELCVKIING